MFSKTITAERDAVQQSALFHFCPHGTIPAAYNNRQRRSYAEAPHNAAVRLVKFIQTDCIMQKLFDFSLWRQPLFKGGYEKVYFKNVKRWVYTNPSETVKKLYAL